MIWNWPGVAGRTYCIYFKRSNWVDSFNYYVSDCFLGPKWLFTIWYVLVAKMDIWIISSSAGKSANPVGSSIKILVIPTWSTLNVKAYGDVSCLPRSVSHRMRWSQKTSSFCLSSLLNNFFFLEGRAEKLAMPRMGASRIASPGWFTPVLNHVTQVQKAARLLFSPVLNSSPSL